MKINLILNDDTNIEYEVKEPNGKNKGFAIWGIHKSGSSLFTNIINKICDASHIPYINIPDFLFKRGIPLGDIKRIDNFPDLSKGYVLSGNRTYWNNSFFDISNIKNILLIRDIKDVITSHYYSLKISHTIPKGGKVRESMLKTREKIQSSNIDEYALNTIKHRKAILNNYLDKLPCSTIIYRYEDIIFYKREWIKSLCKYLEIDLSTNEIYKIVDKFDIVPEQEDQSKHVRKVIPGDYKTKLKPETIKILNTEFEHFLTKFNYINNLPKYSLDKI